MLSLDKIDRRILAILQTDGRISNTELSQRIGIPATSMSDRFKRLQRQGFITGFSARLDPTLMGFDLLVFIEVMLDKTTPDVFENFAQAVRKVPEVIECHMVAGGFDYLIKTRLANMASYRKFLGEVVLAWPGVCETRTYAVMEEIKNDGPLPIAP
ncbi:Lrp/AsnC ligand binding domain-containing protein [Sinorhizobium sp. BG8]|uniref:Lrp/AsnC ligand binding domain-containing protein n=1 Tax=Sinorhizobium sp. BG8 TaxID=2613773 RepID=UPI002485DC5D|nr:Lrp/AsnC ligand binding domain-containing protein [Sinorhizobium sp. BG8]